VDKYFIDISFALDNGDLDIFSNYNEMTLDEKSYFDQQMLQLDLYSYMRFINVMFWPVNSLGLIELLI
jgi:hypothetical protein